MDRTFAVASLPISTSSPPAASSMGFTSVSVTASRTSTTASPSSIHSSNARLSTPAVSGIVAAGIVAAEIVILILALGAWYYLRRRKPNEPGLGIPSSQSSIQQPPKGSGSATPSLGSMQQPGSYTAFPFAPLSVDPNESPSQIAQPDAAKGVYYGPLALSQAALQNHDDRSATMLRGLKGGASPSQDVPSDLSQPCCTQPSF